MLQPVCLMIYRMLPANCKTLIFHLHFRNAAVKPFALPVAMHAAVSWGRWPGAFGRATSQQGRSAASGDVRGPPPCSQRYSTISNKIARKDISSDESLQQGRNRSRELNFSPYKPILAVPGMAHFLQPRSIEPSKVQLLPKNRQTEQGHQPTAPTAVLKGGQA